MTVARFSQLAVGYTTTTNSNNEKRKSNIPHWERETTCIGFWVRHDVRRMTHSLT